MSFERQFPGVRSILIFLFIAGLLIPGVSGQDKKDVVEKVKVAEQVGVVEGEAPGAGWTPFRFSIVEDDADFPGEDLTVYGWAINLPQGFVSKEYGLTTGILNKSRVFGGFRTCFVNDAKTSYGVPVGGAANIADSSYGFDIAGGINYTRKEQQGVQIAGWFNYSLEDQAGVRIGGIGNVSTYSQDGMQITGLLNQARTFQGVQIAGLINLEDKAQGIQLGSVNIIGYKIRKSSDVSGCFQLGAANWVCEIPTPKGKRLKDDDWIFQLGVLNYAGGSGGVQIGLININRKGFLPFFPFFNCNL